MPYSKCIKPSSSNFDPSTTEAESHCVWLKKIDGKCLVFEEPTETVDHSFTASWSVLGNWVFFHDYYPDFYAQTREKLLSYKSKSLYKHNEGGYGKFYEETPEGVQTVKPFFVDMVFKADSELLLETLEWTSSVLYDTSDLKARDSEWKTLTHISIWNSQQHTGRIELKDVFEDMKYDTSRNTRGIWSFNKFRNTLKDRGTQFLLDIFNNYAVDSNQVEEKSWYEAELLQDKYFVVRLEFDNLVQKQLTLHEVSITAQKVSR